MLDDYHTIADRRVHDALVAALIEHAAADAAAGAGGAGRAAAAAAAPARARAWWPRCGPPTWPSRPPRRAGSWARRWAWRWAPTAAAALAERTEGWAAGLQIAALALRERERPAAFVAELPRQPAARRWLPARGGDRPSAGGDRGVSCCTRPCSTGCARPLCDAVLGDAATGRGGAAGGAVGQGGVMAALATPPRARRCWSGWRRPTCSSCRSRRRDWYRYHHLFAEACCHRLRAEAPGFEPELRRRAAAWYETAGYPVAAVEQALAGEDWERAARLIEGLADASGGGATSRRWSGGWRRSRPSWRARPQLLLARAGGRLTRAAIITACRAW